MKTLIFITLFITLASMPVYAGTGKVSNYCRKTYGKPCKIVRTIPLKRKGKRHIYVWKLISRSQGKNGKCKYGVIAYDRTFKKGVKVVSYLIYNPDNNACDDVVKVYYFRKGR